MKYILVAAFSLCFGNLLMAQQISGTVVDESGVALNAVTISLMRAADSSVQKYAVSKETGKFSFQNIAEGQYLIKASMTGYHTMHSELITLKADQNQSISLRMAKLAQDLTGVTISAVRPMIEVKADKMIVNVEGTINAVGNDALELLRKAPGVLVDKDDNISLSGKNGVQVYIDGKPSPLSGADLSNYLKSLQSAQIDNLEIITNPSAKYEAAGNAGIINIRLKKNKSFGTNGSVTAGYNIGTYSKYNGGINLNNRNAKTNIFGSYNYNRALYVNNMSFYREQADTLFNQYTQMKSYNQGHNYKAGVDYFLNSKSTLGFIINGNITENDFNSKGPMEITYLPTKTTDRILVSNNKSLMDRENTNMNLNFRNVKQNGTELNIDADYGNFKLNNNQYQPNIYYDASGQNILYSNIYRMISPTTINLYSGKIDYEMSYKKGKLGFGAKVGFVQTDNDFERYDINGTVETKDRNRSNRFDYTENINAAYVNYNRPFKGFTVQAGLRLENTHSEGLSTGEYYDEVSGSYKGYDSTNKRDYTNLFPSAAISFNKNPKSMFNVTYSRRIDRPAYQDLNPFEFKLNDYTYMKGNTQLRPQYSNSVGITHTYHYKLNTTLNYTHVKDIFTQLPDTTDKSKSFMSKKNLATQDVVSLNISYPFQYKWYSFFANVNSNYSLYKADFGGGDRVINLDAFNLSYYMQNTFKLGNGFTGELSGFYTSPSIWQGTFKMKSMYGIDAGLQKTLFNKKANLKLSVSDIFKTMKWSGETNFSGSFSRASGNWESRQLKLNFSYRFGNSKVKAARQRKTSQEEEAKRTQSGTGGMGGQ